MITTKKEKKRRSVPRELIYEMRYGSPIYYRDYDKVLAGEKSLEEVMGSSKLQALLIWIILKYLAKKLNHERYEVLTNEAGFQWAPRTWRNLDIAVFDKRNLLKEGIDDKYAKTPPEVVIEIDTKADLRKYSGEMLSYMKEKINDLLNAGVKKVIWYTTDDKKVMVATKKEKWFISDWDEDVEIIDNLKFNLAKLLTEEGIKI
ncbi:Uma2 family endonuclease [Persephonella atlantica]|uniref:Uma2 family endonuclease n=1 Tax=Persephonella atlantica TaxID=2699429 RepID=A0ABS1GFI5_9AQUI|nr:Uma2 family endonuclease [Persephonella atlantica]MBK3331680.1 Uma2 family endonuclease [Persephonella atlantica]